MKQKLFTGLKVAFFLSIGIALIWLFTSQLGEKEKEEILQAVKSADYSWILISMVMGTLAHISRALRWKQLMEPLGYNPSTRNTFFAVMVMYFANLAIPRLGEVTRCAILKRYEGVPVEKSFGTVVAERAMDLVFLGLVFLLALGLQLDIVVQGFEELQIMGNANGGSEEKSLLLPILVGCAVLGGVVLFLLRKHPKIQGVYNKILELALGFISGIHAAIKVKRPLVFLLHTAFIWIMYFMMVYICFFAIPQTSEVPMAAGLTILVFGSVGIILVPGGIGIYPLIVAKILTLYFVEESYGYAFGWIVWLGQTLLLLVWGVISLALLPVFNKGKRTHGISTTES